MLLAATDRARVNQSTNGRTSARATNELREKTRWKNKATIEKNEMSKWPSDDGKENLNRARFVEKSTSSCTHVRLPLC